MVKSPKYIQLASEFKELVQNGTWVVGELIPTESDLIKEFGVSRITIRGAIKELANEGLVVKQQGVGTTVVRKSEQQNFVHISDSLDSILQLTGNTKLEILSILKVNHVPAELQKNQNNLSKTLPYFHISAVRLNTTSIPICISDFFIPSIHQSIIHFLPNHKGSLALLMEKKLGVKLTEIEQTITAYKLSSKEAELLKVPKSTPGLKIFRWHRDTKLQPLISSISIYPQEQFRYSILFRRNHLQG
jgi:DNA-binding GntR family transcriptional regulator